jgi:hypothetical protein
LFSLEAMVALYWVADCQPHEGAEYRIEGGRKRGSTDE